MNKQINKL